MSKQMRTYMSAADRLETMRRLTRDALLIKLGIQNDGAVYMIHPLSLARIKDRYPDVEPLRSIMMGHYKDVDFEKVNLPRLEQIVLLLTNLTQEQIAELGGVRIFDQENERLVWEWKPMAVNS